jgi:2-polyprenyl-3-methyl-5-hydroxy-6-metoxy-1,4-benzoquinol methylase
MSFEKTTNDLSELISNHGEFIYDIPLTDGVWTRGNMGLSHTRLKRILQVVSDISKNPLDKIRVLDLGSLDGQFSLEFAYHGSDVVGLEIREDNVAKSNFCKENLRLTNVQFIQDDVRNISVENYGMYDVIICSGLLYHLTGFDSIELIPKMYQMTNNLLIVDTHIALEPKETWTTPDGRRYNGKTIVEHTSQDSDDIKESRILASSGNDDSFWFTRPSLVNLMIDSGFTSVYEAFGPVHLNFGQEGVEHYDRCTFVAVKGSKKYMYTSPNANVNDEKFPEGTLSYGTQIVVDDKKGSPGTW